MILYIDGSGFNGKVSRALVCDEKGKIVSEFETDKSRTNNEMEYMGLQMALMHILEENIKEAVIYTDSKLVEGQMNKNWKINFEHLRKLNNFCKRLMENKKITIKWVSRDENKAGKIFEKKLKGG